MEHTRRNFALSLAMSSITVWLYFGFHPFGGSILPMTDGTVLNTLMQIVAIPLTLAIVVGGGLAAAAALTSGVIKQGWGFHWLANLTAACAVGLAVAAILLARHRPVARSMNPV